MPKKEDLTRRDVVKMAGAAGVAAAAVTKMSAPAIRTAAAPGN